eukprot:888312-Rhodomonas_salina.1
MECSPCTVTLCVENVSSGLYLDEGGQCVYMCKVGMMDEEGECENKWHYHHDGVTWEVKECYIHKKVLSHFLHLPHAAVFSALLIADWSRQSSHYPVDAGVPMQVAFKFGKHSMPSCKQDCKVQGVFYQLAQGTSEEEQCSFFEWVGTSNEDCVVLGVVTSNSLFLRQGAVAQLLEPEDSLFFVTAVTVQYMDWQLEGGETQTELHGYECKRVPVHRRAAQTLTSIWSGPGSRAHAAEF